MYACGVSVWSDLVWLELPQFVSHAVEEMVNRKLDNDFKHYCCVQVSQLYRQSTFNARKVASEAPDIQLSYNHILLISLLALSYIKFETISPFSPSSRSSSVSVLGCMANAAYVPAPRFLERVPGFTTKTPSMTYEMSY